jgi:putative redox protein
MCELARLMLSIRAGVIMNATETSIAHVTTPDPPLMTTHLTWKGDLAFDAEVDGFTVTLDAEEAVGGHELGPRPKTLILTALSGCTAMDVAAILKKMRVQIDRFEVSADGVLTTTHPRVFSRIDLRYDFFGDDLPADKLQRAVRLSQEKYCGVSAMLRPVTQLARSIHVNGVLLCHAEDPPPSALGV